MDYSNIHIDDYYYPLPDDSIAQYTLAERDRSRLLIIRDEKIKEDHFYKIADFLPERSLLVFNDTRVLHSRFIFRKSTGALIEIFCLEPIAPSREMDQALESGSGCVWRCMVGNAKKWKKGSLTMKLTFNDKPFILSATKATGEESKSIIKFEWNNPEVNWAQVLELFGRVPLPPYIKREPGQSDNIRYQTIYASCNGSVAAPTAGLHFTDELIKSFAGREIRHTFVTLHVGEGTFKPVTTPLIADHIMHGEKIGIRLHELEKIIDSAGNIVSVGTTSLRTLESLYWFGVKTLMNGSLPDYLVLEQWEPYHENILQDVPVHKALTCLMDHMKSKNINELVGETKLIIVPGYQVRMAKALITNFHQPRSTLLLLVAAFAGPVWRKAYDYALENNFRFLSYGDSCLFFRKDYIE